MTSLYVFLFGMPFVLMAGAGATVWFARRAAAEIRSHSEPRTVVFNPRKSRTAEKTAEIGLVPPPHAKAS